MASEESSAGVSKKLHDLKVIDLKNELEKRNLDKTGVKATLIERLAKALKDSGINPNDYLFTIASDSPKKISSKRNSGRYLFTASKKNETGRSDEYTCNLNVELSQKDKEDDSENSDNDGQDTNDSEYEKSVHSEEKMSDEKMKAKRAENPEKNKKNEKKTGLEAADIVQDALQLDIDDELNEYRDDEVLDLTDPRKDNFK
ncbi:SAFB-like transcription modulator isoform X1, partial [Leptotrombidium deliense]